MGKLVPIESADGTFEAYLARPAAKPVATILVLQEVFGLTPFIRGVCDWLAGENYLAVAPDLFWRQQPAVVLAEEERERAMQLMQNMDAELALRDCAATLAQLRGASPAAALGYCLGGKLAYLLAARGAVDAAISYYGVGIQGALDLAPGLEVPLLLHLPLEDALCPPPAREAIAAAMRAAPAPVTLIEHPGVGHAFARLGGAPYDAAAAGRANRATLAFLAELFRP